MILVEKYANHQPLNRQSEHYAREGIELSVSTLADHVGACAATLRPLYELIKRHVFAAERIHGDDTTVPVLAKVKTRTGRIWTYVRDDRPFDGRAPPAAVFFYSPDRAGIHPEQHLAGYSGILQADAYSGFNTQAVRARRRRLAGALPQVDHDLADCIRGGSAGFQARIGTTLVGRPSTVASTCFGP
jgi:hypothetical protein